MKYIVGIREVHINYVEVEAENTEQAKEVAGDFSSENSINVEYSHSLAPALWSVEAKGK